MTTTIKHMGLVVTKTHETKSALHGWKLPLTWAFDFTGVSDERIRELATETLVIRTRNATGIKDLTEAEAKKLDNTVYMVSTIGSVKREVSANKKAIGDMAEALASKKGISKDAAFKLMLDMAKAAMDASEEDAQNAMEAGESA